MKLPSIGTWWRTSQRTIVASPIPLLSTTTSDDTMLVVKVLQVATDDDRRGAQMFAAQLGERLTELGHDVQTVALTRGAVGGLDLDRVGRSRLGPTTLRRLRRLMQGAEVTIAHGSSTLPAASFAGLRITSPLVYRQISDPLYWTPTALKRLRVRLYYRFPDHVVALSHASERVLAEHFGVPTSRTSVIPNAVDERGFALAETDHRDRARVAFGLDPSRPVIGFVGSMSDEKGVGDLLAASQPGWQVVLAGDGPDRPEFEAAARAQGLDAHFIGTQSDTRAVYAAADVLVLPSWSEQQPGVLIEAALVGTPCVATDVGGVRELVDDGRAALLVPPRDPEKLGRAIEELLSDPDRQQQLRSAARAHMESRHTLHVVARQWDEELTRLARR